MIDEVQRFLFATMTALIAIAIVFMLFDLTVALYKRFFKKKTPQLGPSMNVQLDLKGTFEGEIILNLPDLRTRLARMSDFKIPQKSEDYAVMIRVFDILEQSICSVNVTVDNKKVTCFRELSLYEGATDILLKLYKLYTEGYPTKTATNLRVIK
jgi:hypothetical protein